MPVRLGLPSPRISTKLYGLVVLFLAMVYALAAAAIHFAGETEARGQQLPARELRQCRVDRAPAGAAGAAPTHGRNCALRFSRRSPTQDESAYRELNVAIAGLIDHVAPDRSRETLAALCASRVAGELGFRAGAPAAARSGHRRRRALCVRRRWPLAGSAHRRKAAHRRRRRHPGGPCRPGPLAHDLGGRRRRCDRLADRPAVPAAAAPHAGAHARHRLGPDPARAQRYLGGNSRHRRSGRVRRAGALGGRVQGQIHRASEQESRLRASQPAARRGHQQHAAGAEHVRRAGAAAHVQQAIHRNVRRAGRADAAGHGALRAAGVSHQEGCAPFGNRGTCSRGRQPPAIHARRIRRRPHHRGVAPAPQRRRLGIAARGHYRATQAGGEDRAPRAPRRADGPRQSHAVPRAARAEPAAAWRAGRDSPCFASISITSRPSTTRSGIPSATCS